MGKWIGQHIHDLVARFRNDVYFESIIELGHASDTTIARSASGTVTIEGKKIVTEDKQKFIKTSIFSGSLSTTETFIPFAGTAENTNVANASSALLMPTNGKLLKVHMKVSRDHSGGNTTLKLYNWDENEAHGNTTHTIVGTKQQTGPSTTQVGVFDFQSLDGAGDSGTNVFTAGEMLALSVTNSSAITGGDTKYFLTLVFELDWSSY
tara:strand:- start:154 stop:777 length:624 start_codon:yes stop_codon:yes gene_type:complete